MKKYRIIVLVIVLAGMTGCKNKRSPGWVYMPDMAYSRAYETYASTDALKKKGINYTALPVHGTIARGDLLQIYELPNDSSGYAQSANFKNPFPADSIDKTEAERLFLVNCGICHGAKLDGNGPLFASGVYPNKPRDLTDDYSKKLADGTMYHVITYGKGVMGSYASQLNPVQRWMVIDYIRSKQGKMKMDSTAKTPVADTATKTQK